MDNSFITMDKALLTELAMTILTTVKEKLAEHQINLDFDKQSQAEKLVVRHIEDKLVEIIKFLQ